MDLVTGATGHIGNVLVRELLKQGRRVRALVRPAARLTALEGLDVDIARGDILQPQSLNSALQGVEVVYHLAAKVNVVDGPDTETEQINFEGTENILAAVRKAGVRRLVYASSIYALKLPAAGTPINERLPFETDASQGVYDASKAHASRAVLQAAAQGLDAVIVCPTAVVGPYDFHASEVGRAIQLYLRPG